MLDNQNKEYTEVDDVMLNIVDDNSNEKSNKSRKAKKLINKKNDDLCVIQSSVKPKPRKNRNHLLVKKTIKFL